MLLKLQNLERCRDLGSCQYSVDISPTWFNTGQIAAIRMN